MVNVSKVVDILGELALLRYFPADEAARVAIARIVCAMIEDEDQARWLVRAMTSGAYNDWPGPRELRAVFCSRYKPKDGVEAHSEVFPEGIPDRFLLLPAAAPQLAPPPDDPRIAGHVKKLAAAKSMPKVGR